MEIFKPLHDFDSNDMKEMFSIKRDIFQEI